MITLNLFKSIQHKRPTTTDTLSIPAFLDRFRAMKHTPLTDKLQSGAFTLCNYQEGQNRNKDNIQSVSGIVLDIDQPQKNAAVVKLIERLEATGKAHIVHTTYSSQGDALKLRVILPFAQPVSASDYKDMRAVMRAAKVVGLPTDPACRQPAQLYFLPSCKPGTEDEHVVQVSESSEGWTLDCLPAFEDGDHERFLSKPANSSRRAKRSEESGKGLEIIQLMKQVLKYLSPTVDPTYTEGRFYIYGERCWGTVSEKQLCKLIMTEVFPYAITRRQALEIVDDLAARYAHETFPLSPWLEKGSKRDPLIALENGTLNPRTGKMVPSKPEHYLRSVMDYSYDPEATCPQWLQFLDSVFAPDWDKAQKIALLQEFIGYLLIPSTRFQKMLWMVGRGSNGKSVINEIIALLLGDANISSIPLHRLSQRFQAAELIGKLANLNDELPANIPLQDDLLKQAVAGNLIQGERKGKDPFYFAPYARFVVAMNQLPRVNDTSHGFFRRVLLLPFNRVIQPHEQDRDLVSKLHEERAGIFVWALEGLQRLLKNDAFTEVPSSLSALEEFKQENNPVELFFRDIILLDENGKARPGGKVLIADIYQLYRDYCSATGCNPLGLPRLGRELTGLGVTVLKSNGKRYYQLQVRTLEEAGVISKQLDGWSIPPVPQLADIDDELRA